MSAKFIHKNNLDKKEWDDFVDADLNATIFNKSFYLDAVCDSWYVYRDEAKSFGIVVCETIKLGQKNAYPPFYHMYVDFVGDITNFNSISFEKELLSKFKIGIFHFTKKINFSRKIDYTEKCYQFIENHFDRSKIVNRKIKKIAEKYPDVNFKIHQDFTKVLSLIYSELGNKLDFFSTKSAEKLTDLVSVLADKNQLIVLEAQKDGESIGGLLAMEYQNRLIYLKGASLNGYMNDGLMYSLMNHLIEYSIRENKIFDFGGSNVEGVRYFNNRFGAIENHYFVYKWNNAPFWFNALKKLKVFLNKA